MVIIRGIHSVFIPKWNTEPAGLEKFIFELEAAKKMQVIQTDKNLIYAALVKSRKVDLMANLTKQQVENLDAFIIYLRSNFGPSLAEQRQAFANIKQERDENEVEYFNRIQKHYSMMQGTKLAKLEAYQKEDIKFAFFNGLISTELKRIMMINANLVEYEKIGLTARTYAASLNDISKVYSIKSGTQKQN